VFGVSNNTHQISLTSKECTCSQLNLQTFKSLKHKFVFLKWIIFAFKYAFALSHHSNCSHKIGFLSNDPSNSQCTQIWSDSPQMHSKTLYHTQTSQVRCFCGINTCNALKITLPHSNLTSQTLYKSNHLVFHSNELLHTQTLKSGPLEVPTICFSLK
jgi:hypothetical protein